MQNSGIATEIYSLVNHEEIRPTTNLIVSKNTAYDYLNNSNPNLEKLTTQYYETFAITGRFTGYFSNITLGEFYNNLSSKYSDSTAILGGLNSTARKEDSKKSESGSSSGGGSSQTTNQTNSKQDSENQQDVVTNPEDLTAGTSSIVGDRGTENFGIALFDEDVLCGELTATESICHSLITNNVDACIISIDNPVSEKEIEKLELQLFPQKTSNIKVDIKDDAPNISIKLTLDADIMTLDKDVNYETNEVLSKISDSTKKYLDEQFDKYFDKISKQYNVDIDNFNIKARNHFSTISEWEIFNWDEKYKKAKFDVTIDINVLSTMLITKT